MKRLLKKIKEVTGPVKDAVNKSKKLSTAKSLEKTRRKKVKDNKKPTQQELKDKKEKLEKELNKIKSLMSPGSRSKTTIKLSTNNRR